MTALQECINNRRTGVHRRARERGRAGYIYFLKNNEYIKIGCSRHLEQRTTQLQAEFPGAKLIHAVSCDDVFIAERKLHEEFKDRHYRKEWYKLTEEDIQSVQEIVHIIDTYELMDIVDKAEITALDYIEFNG